ncbi:hypothetical protein BBP40_001127 [Aspergillus hancockii]|nr:hypothetical protein BBP40_001127 [Aspergillus hancockii]
MHITLPSVAPIAGGCALPDASRPTIPFFGNIRQNMDLLGGVGQIPLQLPDNLTELKKKSLPPWLREATDPADQGRSVSENFLDLEKKELERMKQALTYDKSADNSIGVFPEKFRVAGIEKGTKNRYNDIYPFDHSRVKLQDVPPGECDYVNANYMKAEYSNIRYIATQAPVPDTFNDFWRVIWEQDVKLVVSLTAEVERGQIKCHPYWDSGRYGPLQVNNFSQKYIHIDSQQVDSGPSSSWDPSEDSGKPYIIVRHFGLSHSAFPFQPLREVTQLQYPYWPDFGTTSQPAHLLKLIDQCDKVRSATPSRDVGANAQRPVLVHCSAGCGRTGTFCTVDSVLDMLKRRPAATTAPPQGSQTDSNSYHDCIYNGNLDLIAKTVADLLYLGPEHKPTHEIGAMLLNLPPELIQLVLYHTNTSAFLQAAFSCRTLYIIASNCREVLLHHLDRIPGLNESLLCLESQQLFRVLKRRAFQQLYGAQFSANCTNFNFGTLVLDVKASSLAPSEHQGLALVARGQDDVWLFRADYGQLQLKARLKLHRPQPGVIEVLRTAFDADDGLYVLQRFTPAVEEDSPDSEHPFIRQALQSCTKGQIYLVRYCLRSRHGPVRICTFPDHADHEPLALAAAHRDTFAISWQHCREGGENEVILYNAQSAASSHSPSTAVEINYDSCVLVDGLRQCPQNDMYVHSGLIRGHFASERGPIIDLTFNDRSSQLLYYYRAQTLYGSFQRINMTSFPVQPTLHENSSLVQFSGSLRLPFSIAIPFYGTHATRVEENGLSRCQWEYLAFGIATHRTEDWTVACLLKSEAVCSSRNCGHILNLERGRRFPEWTVVARLWGFQDSTNSLGCIVAASKRGTRIAIANWNVLYIWALQPSALIERNASGFYPSSLQSSSSDMIELRPVVLPLDAVCFKLRFMDAEDELLAITDRGLMYWDLGPLGRGQRMTQQLSI